MDSSGLGRRHDRVYRELHEEPNDLAMGIIAAQHLDTALRNAISSLFRRDLGKDIANRIFKGPEAPLGDFRGKIDLAYALGVLEKKAWRDAHLIRKIRNEYGHPEEPPSFQTESIANRCRELWLPVEESRVEKPNDPRSLFLAAVMTLLHTLWVND